MQGSYFDSIERAWLDQRPGGNLKLPETEKLLEHFTIACGISQPHRRRRPRVGAGRYHYTQS
jgi:hypothetical protein